MARPRKTPTQAGQPPLRDVNAAVRVKAAIALALAGNDWDTIAAQSGYPSRGAAFKAVQRELERTLRPACDEYRNLESLRLDALLTVYWPKAMSGDGWSFDRVLRLMERRSALLGVDKKADGVASTAAAQTLIRRYDADVEAV